VCVPRTYCVTITALGLLTAACALCASAVPTMLPSLVRITIFAVLAVAISATSWLAFRAHPTEAQDDLSEILHDNSRLRQELETLRHLHAQLLEDKSFLQFLKVDQDHERQLLAQDLHDLSLSNLTSGLFQIEAIAQRAHDLDSALEGPIDLLRESLHQARRVMNGLSPTLVQDEGVIASLERLVAHLEESVDQVRFEHDVEFDRLSPLCECAMVQLVREAFDQIRRGQSAGQVTLELIQHDDRLQLRITADGQQEVQTNSRIQECIDVMSGHLAAQEGPPRGNGLHVDFSVTDLIQSDTIKEKSQAFS